MNTNIHHYFVATRANTYHPHLLRWWSLALIGFAVILMQLFFNLSAAQPAVLGFATNVDEAAVINLTNQRRQQFGVESLSVSSKLTAAARSKAHHMFDNDYWAHVGPQGTQPWDFFRNQNYEYVHAGENLAKNFATSAGVIEGWMNSTGHRDNLLNSNYTEIGIAAVNGQLQGEDTTLVVALYGRPLNSSDTFDTVSLSQPVSSLGKVQQQQTIAQTPTSASSVLGFNSVSMTWAQRASLPVFGFIAALYIGQHIVLSRKKLQWDHASHPRPLLQAGVMIGLMVAIILSGQGVVL